jgi:hypothetical protein
MLGYELLKRFNKATEDAAEGEYFELLESALAALDELELDGLLIDVWFSARLLNLAGHSPNLKNDIEGKRLDADKLYAFDPESMGFIQNNNGKYDSGTIKLLRLLFGLDSPEALLQVKGITKAADDAAQLIRLMMASHMRP